METDAIFGTLSILLAVLLLIYLVRRNKKDQKNYEQDTNRSEIKPKKHDNKHV